MSSSRAVTDGAASETGAETGANKSSEADDKYAKIRCLDIAGEWRKCISAYRQFHEYYIHGQFHHCQEEKRRIKLCLAWKTMQREEAKVALVQSLEEEQANMHPEEPVWPLRDTPPPDW